MELRTIQKNPLLAAEMARVEAQQPLAAIDNLRYQLPSPTSNDATVKDWKASLQNAYAQLEHQHLRYFYSPMLDRLLYYRTQADKLGTASIVWC